MPKAIACIPHKLRMDAHRVDYLRAISEAMDYPFQSEDGRALLLLILLWKVKLKVTIL